MAVGELPALQICDGKLVYGSKKIEFPNYRFVETISEGANGVVFV